MSLTEISSYKSISVLLSVLRLGVTVDWRRSWSLRTPFLNMWCHTGIYLHAGVWALNPLNCYVTIIFGGVCPSVSLKINVSIDRNPNPGARRSFGIKVVNIGRYRMLKDIASGKILKTKSEVSALQVNSSFLSRCNQHILLCRISSRGWIPAEAQVMVWSWSAMNLNEKYLALSCWKPYTNITYLTLSMLSSKAFATPAPPSLRSATLPRSPLSRCAPCARLSWGTPLCPPALLSTAAPLSSRYFPRWPAGRMTLSWPPSCFPFPPLSLRRRTSWASWRACWEPRYISHLQLLRCI